MHASVSLIQVLDMNVTQLCSKVTPVIPREQLGLHPGSWVGCHISVPFLAASGAQGESRDGEEPEKAAVLQEG